MTRYVVLIYEQQSPDWPADMPPEVLQASEEFDGWIAEQGGRTIAGLALESSATATSIRGGAVTDGPSASRPWRRSLASTPSAGRDLGPRHRPGRHDPGGGRWRRGAPALDSQVLENH